MRFTILDYEPYTVSDGSEWAKVSLKDARRPNFLTSFNCRIERDEKNQVKFPALELLNKQHGRKSESGNIFFALFGAVALIGVVGAATTTMMRGPLSTTVLVNNRTKADTQILMAAQLISKASAENIGADCDADGILEPIQPASFPAGPAGAGGIPSGLGLTALDPWGTPYAYCAYDHGARDQALCPGRLAGDATIDGVQIGIISAGPNKEFETTCQDAPAYISTVTPSDDLVTRYSPAQVALFAGSGIWYLDSADASKATTDKNLSIDTQMQFSSSSAANFSQGSRVDLGAGGFFFLPDQTSLTDLQCTVINKGSVRRQTVAGEALEICDGAAWQAVGIRNFNKLLDVADYAGNAGKVVRYNAAEDGLDAVSYDWLSLTDTPDDYAGQGGKLLAVDDAASGQRFAENLTYNPDGNLILGGSGAVKVPAGATAEQPAGAAGMIRFNTTKSKFEGFDGAGWKALGGDSASGSMLENFPDAIKCTGSGYSTYYDLYLNATGGANYSLRGNRPESVSGIEFSFSATGAYLGGTAGLAGNIALYAQSCVGKSIAQHYAAGTAYNFTGPVVNISSGGASGTPMLENWPDAIKCSGTGGSSFFDLAVHQSTQAWYLLRGANGITSAYLYFNGTTGAFSSIGGNGINANFYTDCNNKSIAQLTAAGQTYNFRDGGTSGGAAAGGEFVAKVSLVAGGWSTAPVSLVDDIGVCVQTVGCLSATTPYLFCTIYSCQIGLGTGEYYVEVTAPFSVDIRKQINTTTMPGSPTPELSGTGIKAARLSITGNPGQPMLNGIVFNTAAAQGAILVKIKKL